MCSSGCRERERSSLSSLSRSAVEPSLPVFGAAQYSAIRFLIPQSPKPPPNDRMQDREMGSIDPKNASEQFHWFIRIWFDTNRTHAGNSNLSSQSLSNHETAYSIFPFHPSSSLSMMGITTTYTTSSTRTRNVSRHGCRPQQYIDGNDRILSPFFGFIFPLYIDATESTTVQ